MFNKDSKKMPFDVQLNPISLTLPTILLDFTAKWPGPLNILSERHLEFFMNWNVDWYKDLLNREEWFCGIFLFFILVTFWYLIVAIYFMLTISSYFLVKFFMIHSDLVISYISSSIISECPQRIGENAFGLVDNFLPLECQYK